MDGRLSRFAKAQIAGAGVLCHGSGRQLGFNWIARRNHNKTRERPENGEILRRVMAHPQPTVGKAASDRHHLNVCAVIADVIANLLETTKGREVCDRVREYGLTCERHACGDAGHVLFGDPSVYELLWVGRGKFFDH